MPVNAQKSDRNIETSLRLDGAANAVAGVWGVPVATIAASTIRAAVCGRANAGDRAATKAMVVQTMIFLGLLPTGCTSDDRADSLAGWRYCEAVYGRMAPNEFVLT
jgi:Holliday junction resolvasome RuvABC endonuclease subunit